MNTTTPFESSKKFNPSRLQFLHTVVDSGVTDGWFPAAVALVSLHGKTIFHEAFGNLAPGVPTTPDSIFDLASLTKPHTALGLLTLIEEGALTLGQHVSDFIPASEKLPTGKLTLHQLVTHTSGLPPWKALYKESGKESILNTIIHSELAALPGTQYAYSDLGYILLGEIISLTSKLTLSEFLHNRLFGPAGLTDMGYLPGVSKHPRIAPTAHEPSRPDVTMVGVVHDGNCHALGGAAGHAGLFGTAAELAKIGNSLITTGIVNQHRIIAKPTLTLVQNRQIPQNVGGHSVGWFTPPNSMLPRGDILDESTFGHTGFTGTMMVCNKNLGLVAVLLTNRVMNPSENSQMPSIRRRFLNVAASAIA